MNKIRFIDTLDDHGIPADPVLHHPLRGRFSDPRGTPPAHRPVGTQHADGQARGGGEQARGAALGGMLGMALEVEHQARREPGHRDDDHS